MFNSEINLNNTIMRDSKGDSTRGLICDQCTLSVENSKFESLNNTDPDGKGAAFSIENTCNAKVSASNQFSQLEALQGPAFFVKNAKADILADKFTNVTTTYKFSTRLDLVDNSLAAMIGIESNNTAQM